MSKRKTGTREWADSNFNVGIGCSHDCLYCYARSNALRFKIVSDRDDWTKERVRSKIPSISRKEGWVMFPTTHDITPFYLDTVIAALKTHISKGNKVLIVSKPHMECIAEICEKFSDHTDKILFRFTIGTLDEDLAKLWEPGAPSIKERIDCLKYAFEHGFSTSVSMEPFLGDIIDASDAFYAFAPYVTDKIWIGKMNKINNRVKKSASYIEEACELVEKNQRDEKIMMLVAMLHDHEKVEWKDSIKEVIEKAAIENVKEKFKKAELTDKEKAKGRSSTYWDMTPEEQWAEDKRLGILDWDGN